MKAKWTKWGVCALAVVALAGCATGGGGGLSDEELIKNLISDAMTALAAGDIDAMVANYADDFSSDQGGGKAETKEFLQGAKDQGMLDGITANTDDLIITVDGDKATAGPVGLDTAMGSINLDFELEKRDGVWLVTYQGQG